MQNQRLDGFEGTNDEYTTHLEKIVCQLQHENKLLKRQVQFLQPSQAPPTEYTFQLEDPSLGGEASELKCLKRRRTSGQPKPIPTELSEFLHLIPHDEHGWSTTRERIGLRSLSEFITTFILLTRVSTPTRFFCFPPRKNASILEILDDYGAYSNKLTTLKNYATQLSHYSILLFLCISIVSIATGARLEDVDNSTRKFLSQLRGKECKASSKYLSRLRTTALWVAQRIEGLYRAGLKHRAWEIFLLCGPPINQFEKIKHTSDATAKFIDGVTICKPPTGEPHAHISFELGFLTWFILRGKCSLATVGSALEIKLTEDMAAEWIQGLWRTIKDQNASQEDAVPGDTKNGDLADSIGELENCLHQMSIHDKCIEAAPTPQQQPQPISPIGSAEFQSPEDRIEMHFRVDCTEIGATGTNFPILLDSFPVNQDERQDSLEEIGTTHNHLLGLERSNTQQSQIEVIDSTTISDGTGKLSDILPSAEMNEYLLEASKDFDLFYR